MQIHMKYQALFILNNNKKKNTLLSIELVQYFMIHQPCHIFKLKH